MYELDVSSQSQVLVMTDLSLEFQKWLEIS